MQGYELTVELNARKYIRTLSVSRTFKIRFESHTIDINLISTLSFVVNFCRSRYCSLPCLKDKMSNLPVPVFEEIAEDISTHEESTKKTQKKCMKKKIFDQTPERAEVNVYNEKNIAEQLVWRGEDVKRCNSYQNDRHRRQDSRRVFTEGFKRSAWKMKMVTNDDVVIGIRSVEKKMLSFWTTDTEFQYEKDGVSSSTTANSTADIASPSPSFFELARMTPSKSFAKPTARAIKQNRDKICCSHCKIIHDSREDKEVDSPWVGCDGIKDGRECTYWSHACYIGFVNARVADFQHMTYFCPEHNRHHTLIEKLKAKQQMGKKRKASKRK